MVREDDRTIRGGGGGGTGGMEVMLKHMAFHDSARPVPTSTSAVHQRPERINLAASSMQKKAHPTRMERLMITVRLTLSGHRHGVLYCTYNPSVILPHAGIEPVA
jgi:hypothetical protein